MPAFTAVYIVLSGLSGVLNLLIAIYALFIRGMVSLRLIYLLLCGSFVLYTFGAAFEKASDTLSGVLFWTAVQYAGMPFAAPLTLLMALELIGKPDLLPRWGKRLLFVIPAVSFLLVATSSYHSLFYRAMRFEEVGGVRSLEFDMGQWYIVHGSFTSGTLMLSLVLVLIRLAQPSRGFKPQLAAVAVGIAVPVASSLAYLLGLSPHGVDPVPIVLCLTSALYAWAFLRADLITIVPLARDSVMESMGEGVLVMDADWRLLDTNRSARLHLPELEKAAVGRSLHDLELPAEASAAFHAALATAGEAIPFSRGEGASALHFEVYSAPVQRGAGRIGGHLLVLRDTTERRRLQEELHRLASLDSLTGILNRGAFLSQSAEALAGCVRAKRPCSLLLFDLDHFKSINDTYGHEAGDIALQGAASIVRERLEPEMLFARYGGEEFVLLLPGWEEEGAIRFAEQLRAAAEEARLALPDGREIGIRASFGAAASPAGRIPDYLEMYRRADQALYQAKEQGRNRVVSAGAV
ncbi:histidine kinase N-terminal 7TM domain-containing diguanylate cyclase [Paenibacillus pasadenensis]|uniref:histidine kinase N-terminal 7TM domain-containing diguanylate cyclase n=1 Tax=Paenibacillus pasadenensis TaxID=217090 RepID=UPI00040E8477|nr:histidine kinase N-terminal 7TM domain-containing protein [Paenibacillus pasadenensis]